MTKDSHLKALNEVLHRLRYHPFPPDAVAFLASSEDAINRELGDTVLTQIPAYSETRNPDVLPALAQHGPEHTTEILRLLGGGPVGEFDFVREHACRRAEQRFPLEAHLHAFR